MRKQVQAPDIDLFIFCTLGTTPVSGSNPQVQRIDKYLVNVIGLILPRSFLLFFKSEGMQSVAWEKYCVRY